MQTNSFYAIGTPGIAWGDHERALWLARQTKLRSYADDVVSVIDSLATRFAVVPYGELRYGNDHYQQLALKSLQWNHQLPTVLVTGGVHGYETSGVHGALAFLQQRAEQYAGRVNLLVVPCVSPGPTSASIAGMPRRWIPTARFCSQARHRKRRR